MTPRERGGRLGFTLIPLAAAGLMAGGGSSGLALATGMGLALTVGNPYAGLGRRATPRLLQASIICLGAGMDLRVVAQAGLRGAGFALASILSTLAAGAALGRWLSTERDASILINSGTAICGGSAIAAVAPVIRADAHSVSVALGTVFALNAAALLIFPWLGRQAGLSDEQFGLWCALAIHDTSSVVGAALAHGGRALEIATPVKLARALWIVPLAFAIARLEARANPGDPARARAKPKYPWFILGFVVAAALVTGVPELRPAGKAVEWLARRMLVLTLFMIGAGLSRETLSQVGARPLAQGLALWALVAAGSLGAILMGWAV